MDFAAIGAFLLALLLPSIGAALVGFSTPPPDDWYRQLNKPSWTPPGWAFPVVWTILYLLMGLASWLVWRRGGVHKEWVPLTIYLVQLVLNWLWTPLFFGLKRPDVALVEIGLLWLAILATIITFWSTHWLAGALLLPYILWVSIASALNYSIFANNPVSQPQTGGIYQPINRQ
eukprot:jgi/Mesen1/4893/ME000244S04065